MRGNQTTTFTSIFDRRVNLVEHLFIPKNQRQLRWRNGLALCAMSLPTKRPMADTSSIVREDGKYAFSINQRSALQNLAGKSPMRSLGLHYGAYPVWQAAV